MSTSVNHHEILNNYTASLLQGTLRFGSYPSSELVDALTTEYYTTFVDLTDQHDAPLVIATGIDYPYIVPSSVAILKCPTPDRTPGDVNAIRLIVQQCVNILKAGEKVYIHCRGGHGRSAVVAAIILIELGSDAAVVLRGVRASHRRRLVMDDKWRKLGAPQTNKQKQFVKDWVVGWKE